MRYDANVAPQCNEIRATVNFNRRKQVEQERFDDFVTALKLLVKDCGYENEDRMLRDAIVLRSLHSRVQEKCLEEGNALTLERALQIGRNHELLLTNMKTITEEDATVKFVSRSDSRKPHKNIGNTQPQAKSPKLPKRASYVQGVAIIMITRSSTALQKMRSVQSVSARVTLPKYADATRHTQYKKTEVKLS